MNVNMIRPKTETEYSFFSITEGCGTPIKPTHRKAEETFEFKLTKPRETFSITRPFNLDFDSNWMVGLTILVVYISIFIILEENNKFEHYTDCSDDKFSFVELKDKIAEVLGLSHISPRTYNMDYMDLIILKLIENYRQKGIRPMVIIYFLDYA